jgi:hypothetical protein
VPAFPRNVRTATPVRAAALVLVGLLACLLVIGCGGGGLPGASGSGGVSASPVASAAPTAAATTPPSTEAPTPPPTATPTAPPTAAPTAAPTSGGGSGGPDASALAAAGQRLSALNSYRFDVSMRKTNVAAFSGEDMDISIAATVVREPVAATHLVLEGRLEPMLGTYEIVAIGDKAWLRTGTDGEWMARDKGGASLVDSMRTFEPGTLYQGFGSELAGSLERVGTEEHNGVQTVHYRAGAAALAEIKASGGLDGDWSVDIWVSEEDGYLIGMEMTGTGAAADGKPGELALSIQLSHLDDPANVIEPPVTKPGV